jgi:hypothetical protein
MSGKWNDSHQVGLDEPKPALFPSADHQTDLYRGILELILPHRSALYKRPDLADVSGHGGDVINRKLLQVLKKLGRDMAVGDAEQIFSEQSKAKKTGGSATASPTKRKSPVKEKSDEKVTGSASKKRKVSLEGEEDEFWLS